MVAISVAINISVAVDVVFIGLAAAAAVAVAIVVATIVVAATLKGMLLFGWHCFGRCLFSLMSPVRTVHCQQTI